MAGKSRHQIAIERLLEHLYSEIAIAEETLAAAKAKRDSLLDVIRAADMITAEKEETDA